MGPTTSREVGGLLGRDGGTASTYPHRPAFFEEDQMAYYYSEDLRDYMTGTRRDKHYYPHSPISFVPSRKEEVNQRLAEVFALSPSSVAARSWIGAAACELDNPKWDEAVLFTEAARELSRLSGELAR